MTTGKLFDVLVRLNDGAWETWAANLSFLAARHSVAQAIDISYVPSAKIGEVISGRDCEAKIIEAVG